MNIPQPWGSKIPRELHDAIARELVDQGKLLEAGWRVLSSVLLRPDATESEKAEIRAVFMFGAQHMFASVLGMLDADAEPTENDLRRMTMVHNELQAFEPEAMLRVSNPWRKPQ